MSVLPSLHPPNAAEQAPPGVRELTRFRFICAERSVLSFSSHLNREAQ